MKRVLFSMVLLMAVSFSFAQMKNVKEAKSMANDVKPNFKQAELWRDGADRSFCRAYLEERNGPEAQMAMAVRNRCDNGCAGLAVGLAVAGDQEDMDELDGVGQQWLLFPVDGLVLLLDRL